MKTNGGGGVTELDTLSVNLQSRVLVREICRELSLNFPQDTENYDGYFVCTVTTEIVFLTISGQRPR